MPTLLLRLAGPMQSWGLESRFTVRDTGRDPSKSGVIGLLCAALGRPRTAPVDDLAALRMAVRVDREGQLAMDYHTAQNVYKASGGIKDTEVSRRYYLQDAIFLVGLEGEDLNLLSQAHKAVGNPHWPLYLGRKAFVPSLSIWLADGLRAKESMSETLLQYPWQSSRSSYPPPELLRVVIDDPVNGSQERPDVPLSFSERRFARRRVRTFFCECPQPSEELL